MKPPDAVNFPFCMVPSCTSWLNIRGAGSNPSVTGDVTPTTLYGPIVLMFTGVDSLLKASRTSVFVVALACLATASNSFTELHAWIEKKDKGASGAYFFMSAKN